MSDRARLKRRIEAAIRAFAEGATVPTATRDALIEDVATWQASVIGPYGRLTQRGSLPPALPTDVFRFTRIAAHDAAKDVRLFRSSGTTSSDRGAHAFAELDLYDLAARTAAKHMLFPDVQRMAMVVLAPNEKSAPDSSLSYMLARFEEWFGAECTWVWRDDALDIDLLVRVLEATKDPIALLGTSFAFVHAVDALGDARFRLQEGSRIMHTGGYKGRSRSLEPEALRRQLTGRFGVPAENIVAEYGMTELSSQMYEATLRDAWNGRSRPRQLWVPPWVRATPVDPESLLPVEGEAVGILRIDDCANLDSVCCIQTSDLAHRCEDGIVLLGRVPGATPRGCSLAADDALRAGHD